MKRKLWVLSFLFSLLLLIVACHQRPEIDLSKTVVMTEEYFRELDTITTTSSSYSEREKQVKFRLMVEKHPSEEEATAMFEKVINTFEQNADSPEFWDQYNGFFDIKSYESRCHLEATKAIGQDLRVNPN